MKNNLLVLVNKNVCDAEFAFREADCHNIIEVCREYLVVLSEYQKRLNELRQTPEIDLNQSSPLIREMNQQVRTAIRLAVEANLNELNKTEALLRSFLEISGTQAVETFNRLKFKGTDNWQMDSDGARSPGNFADQAISLEEAVATASLLRRNAYLEHKTVF